MNNISKGIYFLILVNIILTLYVSASSGSDSYFCEVGSGCDIVQNSEYADIFGVKLVWFGLVSFIVLLGSYHLFRNNHYWVFFVLSAIGFMFALYFIYLQIYVIGAICKNCMIIDSIAIIVFVLAAYQMNSKIKGKRE